MTRLPLHDKHFSDDWILKCSKKEKKPWNTVLMRSSKPHPHRLTDWRKVLRDNSCASFYTSILGCRQSQALRQHRNWLVWSLHLIKSCDEVVEWLCSVSLCWHWPFQVAMAWTLAVVAACKINMQENLCFSIVNSDKARGEYSIVPWLIKFTKSKKNYFHEKIGLVVMHSSKLCNLW